MKVLNNKVHSKIHTGVYAQFGVQHFNVNQFKKYF